MGNESSSESSKKDGKDLCQEVCCEDKEARYCLELLQNPEKEAKIVDPTDLAAMKVRPELWDFPFENLVLEGGGSKGIAYSGLIKCLDDVGILKNLKRFGGASAGAITATFLALGYTTEEIEDLLIENMQDKLNDSSAWGLSIASNLTNHYGMYAAQKFYNWMSKKISEKSKKGNPAMTFYDLYIERNVELCIVVTNLNLMRQEFCHPKNTPDMPIRDAVRMSMSIPVYFTPKIYGIPGSSNQDFYVDGGVLNNYPIGCFDGWGLSMDPKDSYFKRLTPFKEMKNKMAHQFDEVNIKTMGAVLYGEHESDVMKYKLESRVGANKPEYPQCETKLFVEREESINKVARVVFDKKKKYEAITAFMEALGEAEDRDNAYIDLGQLTRALSKIREEQAKLLFGEKYGPDSIMKRFDLGKDGKINLQELVEVFEIGGVKLWEYVFGYGKIDKIKSWNEYIFSIYNTCSLNLTASNMKPGDVKRTVGINTGYVGTMDFSLEPADKKFAFERGYNATKSFLQYFVVQNPTLVQKTGSSTAARSVPSATE